jgi:hypothetical protein
LTAPKPIHLANVTANGLAADGVATGLSPPIKLAGDTSTRRPAQPDDPDITTTMRRRAQG